MKLTSILLATAAVSLASAQPVHAQATAATPAYSVVRFLKCSQLAAAVERLQEGRPVVQAMIAEGTFIDYGILSHAWGDEWNLVDYFTVADLGEFFDNYSELARRIEEATPQDQADRPAFNELCGEHRDVIYSVVAPPSGS